MRFTSLIFAWLLLGLVACSSDPCEEKLEKDYPEVLAYISDNHLDNYSAITCSVEEHEQYTFNGYQEPKGKCHFFDVSLEVDKLKITQLTFTGFNDFLKKESRLYDFYIYEFESKEDLEKFKAFLPDASLYYDKHKEIHEFFISGDKVYLYYFGFP